MVVGKDRELQLQIINLFHDGGLGGYSGMTATLKSINAVNVRPYKHSSLQKDIVEKMTQELLNSGLIQPSNNYFSFPIVLVKKKDGN